VPSDRGKCSLTLWTVSIHVLPLYTCWTSRCARPGPKHTEHTHTKLLVPTSIICGIYGVAEAIMTAVRKEIKNCSALKATSLQCSPPTPQRQHTLASIWHTRFIRNSGRICSKKSCKSSSCSGQTCTPNLYHEILSKHYDGWNQCF
jgi:hypothetical protein